MTETKSNTIKRDAAIREMRELCNVHHTEKLHIGAIVQTLEKMDNAEPDYRMDEFCTQCKEYDQQKHCCPRFNHVIRTTLEEVIQAQQTAHDRYADLRNYLEESRSADLSILEDSEAFRAWLKATH